MWWRIKYWVYQFFPKKDPYVPAEGLKERWAKNPW